MKIKISIVIFFAIFLFNNCNNKKQSLQQPESTVVSDNFIYVSNVNGDPAKKDSNGYISKLTMDGKISELKFITGLNAPKGLCVVNHIIYVADIDRIAGYNIISKTKVFECALLNNKTEFLNDICFDGNENLYATATDINDIFRINIKTKTITPIYLNGKLNGPNGIAYNHNTLYVCELGNDSIKGGICRIDLHGDSTNYTRLENNLGYLDGLIINNDRLYFSDWVDMNSNKKIAKIWVYDINTKERTTIKTEENMSGCADFFYDKPRQRIIAPLMNENKIIFIPLKTP